MTRGGLWAIWLCLLAATFAPYPVTAQQAQDECAYLPAFQKLLTQLPILSPSQAAVALAGYVSSHENPENCEYSEIDRLLAGQEVKLFGFVAGNTRQDAQVVYRCNQFDPRTARCESPMMDETAHPFSAGIPSLAMPDTRRIKLITELPGATLAAIYRVSLANALDGKVATLLSSGKSEISFPSSTKGMALIAIYKTSGPWRYRKVVWYF